jgi:formylglycine-generating enzyme required for sulfatase activity
MLSNTHIRTLLLSSLLCISCSLFANNIVVTNTTLSAQNTSAQTRLVQFNLSWQNSWRTSSAPFNWDAAWVFVKYRVGATGIWKHATLSTTGHTIPSGATSTQTDAAGIFIYRSVDGTGTFSPSGIQLLWNYGTDGVANDAKVSVRIYAVEMVYNQVGGFQAGSGAINNGELRRANDVTSSGTASTFTITGTSPTVQGNSGSASATNIAAFNNIANDLTGTSTASLSAGYPTGFNAFYAMKYEISQQQYVDFLNTLTYTQQTARTATTPNSAAGTGALINPNNNRNGIDIQSPGSASTPAIYACNLIANTSYNEAADGQHIACNYLSWDDLLAYLAWAALRPMTELEFEKSCRGNQTPVVGELPWGNTSASALALKDLVNIGAAAELADDAAANIHADSEYPIGPVRTGIFATGSSIRSGSGAGYYGNMDLGGNLWERVVTLGNNTGRAFSGNHGNGTITSSGEADVSGWPAAAGTGWRGGAYNSSISTSATSNRASTSNGNNTRDPAAGGRGVRTISSGIVTDGLVLWLDAGIKPSYSGSGTTWTDISGNRNNGTLTNGPTYSSTNGGIVVFDGVNDYVSVPINLSTSNYTIIAIARYTGSKNDRVISSNGNNWLLGWHTTQTNKYFAEGWVSASGGGTAETSWLCYAGTGNYSSDSWELYRNGVSIVGPNNGGTNGPNGIRLGGSGLYPGESSACEIGLVLAYNRVLSAAEILQTFNALKSRFGL